MRLIVDIINSTIHHINIVFYPLSYGLKYLWLLHARRNFTQSIMSKYTRKILKNLQKSVDIFAVLTYYNPQQEDNMMTKRKKRIAKTISITELFRIFPTEQSCIDWLEAARWNGKPVCPHCGGIENITKPASKPNTYWHRDCRNHFTVKTGTVMHSSKTDTRNWMIAIYYYMTGRKGISAMQLSKELGVQYRTAWHMGHRIREACKEGSDFILSKIVEMDATYIGGKEDNKHASKKLRAGRGTVGKQPVLGMRQRGGKTKAEVVESESRHAVLSIIGASCLNLGQRFTRTITGPTA